MASTQAEPEAPRNGPESKDADGPIPNANGVDSQQQGSRGEIESGVSGANSNGPLPPTPISSHNNGAHDSLSDSNSKLAASFYKPPVAVSGFESVPQPYDNAQTQQPGYGYPQHGYVGIPPHVQHPQQTDHLQGSYPGYSHPNQYQIRNVTPPIASKPSAYMNSLPQPRSGGPVGLSYPIHGGQYPPPPSRYPTPTLNQLLQPQPGSGAPVQRYPYGEFPPQQQQPPTQQQQPTSQAAAWPMQHPPRNYTPGIGFKPPGSTIQGGPARPPYGDAYGQPPGGLHQQQQRYPLAPSGPPATLNAQVEAVKNSEASEAISTNARNSSSPCTVSTSASPIVSTVTSSSVPTSSIGSAVATTANNNNNNNTPLSSATTVASGSSPAGSARPPPAPSPAPSPASRSMSPALGPANNVSPSGQTDSTAPRMSHSPMAAQGAYQQPMPPPPHVGMSPYGKMIGGPPGGPPTSMGPYQPQSVPSQQYLPYMTRPPGPGMGPSPYGAPGAGSYGPPPPQQQQGQQQPSGGLPPNSTTNANMSSASPGPRPLPPHMGPPTPYPGYPTGTPPMNQYGPQPAWGPAPNSLTGTPPASGPIPGQQGKGSPAPGLGPQGSPGQGPRPPHTPTHYMKQHLQHHLQQQKMYGMAPSPTPSSGPSPPSQQPGPPQPPQQQPQPHLGPYNPPPALNNSGNMTSPGMPGHPPAAASPVTNIVTTGPDGAGLDEASQQSTLSNTSAASGDDATAPSTPRSRKETTTMTTPSAHHPPFSQHQSQQQLSHPPTPQSTVPSPGAASQHSQHGEEYGDVHSPGPGVGNWSVAPQRTAPSSPKTSNAGDALARLYDFDDNPDRKKFLDQLLRFMDEKGSPISACPTISKNPLDLFRLYLLVRDRGGFVEVTKNKAWKDVATSLGIGASSSAAYTLRKHYTKNLFPWECKFDRGGIDPGPIINQVEASTKKKPANKSGLSVPSPAGSSNSQDSSSFPASGPPPGAMDGYPNYPGYPPHAQPPPHVSGENIAASNPFDDQYNRGANSYPPPPPPSMYSPMGGRPGYPNQGPYHNPYQNEYPTPNSQQYPPYPAPPNRTMYSAPYPEPYSQQGPHQPPPGQAPPPGPPAPDAYGRYLPPNSVPNAVHPAGPFPPRPPAPAQPAAAAAAPVASVSSPAPVPSPSPAAVTTSSTTPLPVPPSPLAQPPTSLAPQPQQQSSSAGPSPAPSPAPSSAPNYPEQNEQQFQRQSGLRQLLASSTLAQQLATPPADRQQPGYPGTNAPAGFGPTPGHPYPGMIRPSAPGPASGMPPMPSRQSTPTPSSMPPAAGPGPATPATPVGGAAIQQGPYPPYGQPGQPPSQQPRQPTFDPYGAYRSSYGPGPGPGPGMDGAGNGPASGWRGGAPYGSQYPPQGSSPGPVQTAGAPWVPPTQGGPQPPRPAWDQTQRYPGPPTVGAAPTYNGTGLQGPPQPWGPPMGPNSINRPPYMSPRPPYRPDGKPYAMPPIPVKPMGPGGPYTPGGMAQTGAPPGGMTMPPAMYPPKRDVYFPSDSVEAVIPLLTKRRRLCKLDVSPVDAWRIQLALKSGLLAESTWAIDVLNVLLFDDASVAYFGLSYMPGLLEVLLEHFRRCLAEIFTILEDMEIGYDRVEEFKGKLKQRQIKDTEAKSKVSNGSAAQDEDENSEEWWAWPKRKPEPDYFDTCDLGSVKTSDLVGERVRLLDGPDMSMNARRGERVGIVPRDKELFVVDARKDWDVHDGFDSGVEQWQMGGGDITQHIVTHFTAEMNIVPFVRVLKQVRKGEDEEANDGQSADASAASASVSSGEENSGKEVTLLEKKNCLAKKGRSLADVLQRIKREPTEEGAKDAAEAAAPKPEEAKTTEAPPPEAADSKKETDSGKTSPSTIIKYPGLAIRDQYGTLKRRKMDDYEDECFVRDESSLYLINDSQELLSRRVVALSNIFRSLSFVPGNENELAKNSTLLVILGKLLLLHHDHPLRSSQQKNYDREEDVDFLTVDASGVTGSKDNEWWWDTLLALRENVLVLVANISGHLDLSAYSEEIARPIIDGLLHWAVCPSAMSQDPFPSFGPHSTSMLSPQRLSLEALCKLCVMEANMDLILATPPFSRLEKLVHSLTRSLCRTEDQVLREFAINLLYYLSAADSGMARMIALHNNSLTLLVSFVEQAEANALAVASQHGIQALRENPESMGTSLDMLRRAAATIYQVSRHPDSRTLLAKLEQRLLALVMSQIMDQSVAALLSKSLYLCNSSGIEC